jgi:hypothetical protein
MNQGTWRTTKKHATAIQYYSRPFLELLALSLNHTKVFPKAKVTHYVEGEVVDIRTEVNEASVFLLATADDSISQLNDPRIVRIQGLGRGCPVPYSPANLMIFHIPCAGHDQGVVARPSGVAIVPWFPGKLKGVFPMEESHIFRVDG